MASLQAVSWATAASATLHCLTGCAIGEVLGMVIGTSLGWDNLPTVVLAVALAFVFGYALTMQSVLRAGLDFRSTPTTTERQATAKARRSPPVSVP